MSQTSECIKPWPMKTPSEGSKEPRTFEFEDKAKVIVCEKDGEEIYVRIICRVLRSSSGMEFYATKMGKRRPWALNIKYAFAKKKTKVTRSKFCDELRRVGAGRFVPELLELA